MVGTRSALLAPLPPPATLALIDEHDPAHKPPGRAAPALARPAPAPRRARRQPPAAALGHAVGGDLVARAGRADRPRRGRGRPLAPDPDRGHARHPAQPSADAAAHPRHRGQHEAGPPRRADRQPPGRRARLRRLRGDPPLPGLRGAAGPLAGSPRAALPALRARRRPARSLRRLRRAPPLPVRLGRRARQTSVRPPLPAPDRLAAEPRGPGGDRHAGPAARAADALGGLPSASWPSTACSACPTSAPASAPWSCCGRRRRR